MADEEKETTEETTEETTPTAEEIKKEYEDRIIVLEKEREEYKTGLSTAHSNLTKKDTELKRQQDFESRFNTRLDGFEQTQKIIAMMQNEPLASGEMDATQKDAYINRFDAEIKRQKEERDRELTVSRQADESRNMMAMNVRAEAVFGEDLDAIAKVRDMLLSGYNDLAEKKIVSAEAKKATDTKEEPVESEDKRFEKRLEEEKLNWMKENNMLVSETGGPSGASLSDEKWLEEEYATGKSSDHARAQKIMSNRT